MARRTPESHPAAFLGDELRRARHAAGFSSQDALAAQIGFDRTVIGKIESGDRAPTAEVLAAWCQACGLTGIPPEWVLGMARRGNGPLPDWLQDWVTNGEQQAARLRWYELQLVPGLLQTEAYARALLTGRIGSHPGNVEPQVQARMDRQAIVTREHDPVELLAVIDQGVLRRGVGGATVMTEQAGRLIEASGWPNVVIQVIPESTAVHDGLAGAGFIIADFERGPALAYQETALRGEPIAVPEDVAALGIAFDRLRSEALPRAASLALLEEAATSWSQAV
jgi:transcriptional regulator with XRE-family HTH domain